MTSRTRRQFLSALMESAAAIAIGASGVSCALKAKPLPAMSPVSIPRVLDRFKEQRRKLRNPRLVAGAAKVDITPAKASGAMIAGFGCNRISKGAHDPIWARTLFLDDGETSVALVSLDLVGLFYNQVVRIRDLISAENGHSIIVCTTHNHEAPDSLGLWGKCLFYLIPVRSGVDHAWMEQTLQRTARCVEIAISRARAATLSFAETEAPEWISENYIEPVEIDRRVRLAQVRDLSGNTIATLVNFGLHVECLWDENPYISADFPGSLYRHLEARQGGVALFFNGVLGGQIDPAYGYDVNPDGTAVPSQRRPVEELFEIAENYGRTLSDLSVVALKEAESVGPEVKIHFSRELLRLPLKNDNFVLAAKLGLIDRDFEKGAVSSEVDLVEIGPASFVTIPGEPFNSIHRAALGMLHGKYRFVISMGNDELGYIMTEAQFKQSKFAYQQTMSVGPQTGPLILDAIARLIAARKGEPG